MGREKGWLLVEGREKASGSAKGLTLCCPRMNELRQKLPVVGLFFVVLAGACQRSRHREDSFDAGTDGAPPSTTATVDDGGPPPSISNAALAVNAVRPSLRACFARQIRRNPTPVGSVTFAIEIGADGRVTAATPQKREGLDDACIACMVEGVKTASFSRPLDGMPATVIAPFTFHSAAEPPMVGPLPSALVPSSSAAMTGTILPPGAPRK